MLQHWTPAFAGATNPQGNIPFSCLHWVRNSNTRQQLFKFAGVYQKRYYACHVAMDGPILFVKFYRTSTGNEPVRDFLLALAIEDRKAIGTDIKTVQFGWPLGMPLVRKLSKDLWEVRSTIADGIVRVLFTLRGNQMLLLHALIKKTHKLPATDLHIARTRLRNYREV